MQERKIFFLSDDVFLRQRLEKEIDVKKYRFTFSPTMSPPAMWDLAVLPAEQILHLSSLIAQFPTILTGKKELVGEAFAAGCIDYLREDWTLDELYYRLEKFFLQNDTQRTMIPQALARMLNFQERQIVQSLLDASGREVHRGELQLLLWGREKPKSRGIDMHIANIRNKIEQIPGMKDSISIVTVHGCGYLVNNCG